MGLIGFGLGVCKQNHAPKKDKNKTYSKKVVEKPAVVAKQSNTTPKKEVKQKKEKQSRIDKSYWNF